MAQEQSYFAGQRKMGNKTMNNHLTMQEQARVNWVIKWIDRMTEKCGGTVYQKHGKRLDWGQALCRECYGPDWTKIVPGVPTWSDIQTAGAWEKGLIPDWVDSERMGKNNQTGSSG